MSDAIPVVLARNAMASRFEIVLHGPDATALRSAGEEALAEIERIEAQLSLFRPSSEIGQINARAAREPVRVSPSVFALLQHAAQLSQETSGAFDLTIGPLVRCWGFLSGEGKMPDARELASARACVGMNLVRFDPTGHTIRFEREGVMLDLGAIGKGYAIDRAVEVLRDAGVTSALIHGGTSTVYAIGTPPGVTAWRVAVAPPLTTVSPGDAAVLELCDEALSVSAVHGKFFNANGIILGHVLDPRTGHPVRNASLAAVVLPSATEADALSTALLVAGPDGEDSIRGLRQGMRTLVARVTPPAGSGAVPVRGDNLS